MILIHRRVHLQKGFTVILSSWLFCTLPQSAQSAVSEHQTLWYFMYSLSIIGTLYKVYKLFLIQMSAFVCKNICYIFCLLLMRTHTCTHGNPVIIEPLHTTNASLTPGALSTLFWKGKCHINVVHYFYRGLVSNGSGVLKSILLCLSCLLPSVRPLLGSELFHHSDLTCIWMKTDCHTACSLYFYQLLVKINYR